MVSLTLIARVAVAAAAAILAGVGWLASVQSRRAEQPYAALRALVAREDARKELQSLGDLPVERLRQFAQAACVQGADVPSVRAALRRQLRGVPAEVVDELVESAVIERTSTQSSVQNTSTHVEGAGRAYSYLAFWSTEFAVAPIALNPTYSTCVMVSGVEIDVGEDVAEWETTVQPRVVGSQPCHCGWISCASCPILTEVTSRRPILKRHRLTLRNQLDLHRWMVKRAVEQARVLVDTRYGLGSANAAQSHISAGKNVEDAVMNVQTWREPSEHSFLASAADARGERRGNAPDAASNAHATEPATENVHARPPESVHEEL